MARDLPDGWRRVPLGEVCETLAGFPFKSSDFTSESGDVRLVRGDNVVQGRLRWSGVRRLPERLAREAMRYALEAGDVVIAMDRPWIEAGLKWAVVRSGDVPSLLVQRVARLRPRAGVERAFIPFLVAQPSFSRYVRAIQTGTAVPHISQRQIEAFETVLPPLADQRAIGAVLRALDRKIQSNERLAVLGEQTIRLAFERVPASGRMPLAQLATEVKTRVDPVERPYELFEQFSIPAYDAGHGPEVCAGAAMASAKTLMPKSPLVLISKLNPKTKRVWWPEHLGIGTPVCSPEFVALTPLQPDGAAWLYGCLAFDSTYYDQLLAAVTGTTGSRQRVRPADVLAATVPVADRVARCDWEAVARPVLHHRTALLRESRTLSAIRDALLPKLVSGQIRVPSSRDAEEQVGTAIEALA